ncbi:NERD domain-containing protein [Thermofilum pendens]|uniref:Restriction endonuclease type IV Mrr domain-containing protein n=1 Tax=Thermofilum pendens (strain DSM 2475 / Hrk 5) TaxID=368408 RepID=A1RXG1_THEPD|nr:NERD domain-containing protein [Thermofilum pendens]ABL77891.1 hypothetical protein Tpen_0482 [Thermofilum pendens Hrk 5]
MISFKVELVLKKAAELLSRGKVASITEIVSETGLPQEFVQLVLESLEIPVVNGYIEESLPGVLVKAWLHGYDVVSLALSSGWSSFEELCCYLAESFGLRTKRNLRFKNLGRRFEVDLIAASDNLVLVVDCKRWRRAPPSSLKKAAKAHLERCLALADKMKSGADIGIRLGKQAKLYPLIVNLYDVGPLVEEGVLILGLKEFKEILQSLDPLLLEEMGAKSITVTTPHL